MKGFISSGVRHAIFKPCCFVRLLLALCQNAPQLSILRCLYQNCMTLRSRQRFQEPVKRLRRNCQSCRLSSCFSSCASITPVQIVLFVQAYMEYAYDYPSRRLAARIHNEYPNAYLRFVLNFQQVYQTSALFYPTRFWETHPLPPTVTDLMLTPIELKAEHLCDQLRRKTAF